MSQKTASIQTTPKTLIKRRHPGEFKVCPLCDTLNVKENSACCCCGWTGEFEHGSHAVQVKMWQMVKGSDELQILLLKELRQTPWHRFSSWLRRVFRKRLDLRA